MYSCLTYIATICCDYQPEILSDLNTSCTSTSTSEGINVNIGKWDDECVCLYMLKGDNSVNAEACRIIANVVHQALDYLLEKASTSIEFSLRTSYPTKRRKMCFVETSTSSCKHGSCSRQGYKHSTLIWKYHHDFQGW
jgi:hypothetical protein